ncbi:hypothetical protein ACT3UJ_06465 [Halomonas sp. 86]|uniref:hypothetical protein n=1 Tax=unclassified Halomonas TaxID=2609666 RepID=UPI004034583A
MEAEGCGTNEPVDYFYQGREAFQKGKGKCDMPQTLTHDEQHYWLAGFRNAEHLAENPFLPVEEYHRIAELAYSAGRSDRQNGTVRNNPFDADREPEQNGIWASVYFDGFGSGYEDFKVLGRPRKVIDVQ